MYLLLRQQAGMVRWLFTRWAPGRTAIPLTKAIPATTADIRAAIVHRLMLALIQLIEVIIPRLPRAGVVSLARLIGWLGYAYLCFSGKRMRVALSNLEVAFGESLSMVRRHAIVRQSLANLALVGLDLFWFSRNKERRIDQYVDFGPGFEPGFHEQPCIFVTAHFGNWELLGQALAHRGCPGLMPYAPLHNEAVQQVLTRLRRHERLQFVPRSFAGTGRALFRALREGVSLGLLLDQNLLHSRGAGFVQMFGLPVTAPLVVGRLSQLSGAQIVPAFCVPMPNGRYYVYRRPALDISVSLAGGSDDAAATQWVMDQFTGEIAHRPEIWFWLHRRWKYIPADAEPHKFPYYAQPVAA